MKTLKTDAIIYDNDVYHIHINMLDKDGQFKVQVVCSCNVLRFTSDL